MAQAATKHIEGSGGKQVPKHDQKENPAPGTADAVLTDAPIDQDDVERKTKGGGPELPAVHEGRDEPGWPAPSPVNALGGIVATRVIRTRGR